MPENEANSTTPDHVTTKDAQPATNGHKPEANESNSENVEKKSLGSTVAKHYNDIEAKSKEARRDSRIFHLRNFNNWIKSVIISDYLSKVKRRKRVSDRLNVLDLACGKGGDLLKWEKGKIDHVVMVDIADVSVEQCKERYGKLRRNFSAEFLAMDCTKTRLRDKLRNKNIKLDLASCQFAFHYSFESYAQADMMLRNLCENLNVGGYFIGTTPDSQKLVKKVRNCQSDSFGNSIYNIKPDNKEEFPLFGSKYMFYLEGVVDCPEFMVYFPVLEKMAAKYNMKLVWKKNFHDIFKENKDQYGFLLKKMRALEEFSGVGEENVTSEHQYKFAKEYLDSGGHGPVGTLSADEWEVAGLYVAFAFEKVEAPKPPVQAPKPPVQAPKPPIEEPKPPIEEPKPPIDEPKPPIEEAKSNVGAQEPETHADTLDEGQTKRHHEDSVPEFDTEKSTKREKIEDDANDEDEVEF